MWIYLTLGSAFFLGIYDVFRKVSVDRNAVLPTMFVTTTSAALLAGQFILFSRLDPEFMFTCGLYVPELSWHAHGLLFLKSVIVGSSWVCTYFSVKHLPVTIAVPIHASGPLWTLLGAVVLFGEKFGPWQWLGMAIILVCYYLFSTQGKREGIAFFRNPWVYLVFLGTLLGACSGLYDKYLMQDALTAEKGGMAVAVLAWFLVYLALLMGVVMLVLRASTTARAAAGKFTWRWSMPLVGVFLVLADLLYFRALQEPEALIGIVSALRRTSVVVSFVTGALLFHEVNRTRKGLILCGVLAGGALIILSR